MASTFPATKVQTKLDTTAVSKEATQLYSEVIINGPPL